MSKSHNQFKEKKMNGCNNCTGIRKQAKSGDYDFLCEQIDRCEGCVFSKEVSSMQHDTYAQVRINYVIAYWQRQRSSSL